MSGVRREMAQRTGQNRWVKGKETDKKGGHWEEQRKGNNRDREGKVGSVEGGCAMDLPRN